MPNLKNPNDLNIAPAQMVGGMRVRQPDANRAPLREEEDINNKTMNEANEDNRELDTNEMSSEEERMRVRALQERQAQEMQAHFASRQPDISKNAGTNVQQNFNPAFQPRSMNH